MTISTQKLEFPGHSGAGLAARLDTPAGVVRGYALFAHCFTCSKDVLGARRLSAELARLGIAVLRFDFTGLGKSGGEFASTNFSSNISDLMSAVDYLRANFEAPALLIGHSLGGAAVLAVAAKVPESQAVITIGAPSDAAHVLHNFGASLDEIEQKGEATVTLGGRPFTITKQFVDDVCSAALLEAVAVLRKPLLILHSPVDEIVGVDNAGSIFKAARHPKSFVSLDKADHLLTRERDALFAASVIGGWAGQYIRSDTPQGD